MIKPRTIVREIDKENQPARPTFRLPESDGNFGGWGPRLRY
jgi:hypothetical protein